MPVALRTAGEGEWWAQSVVRRQLAADDRIYSKFAAIEARFRHPGDTAHLQLADTLRYFRVCYRHGMPSARLYELFSFYWPDILRYLAAVGDVPALREWLQINPSESRWRQPHPHVMWRRPGSGGWGFRVVLDGISGPEHMRGVIELVRELAGADFGDIVFVELAHLLQPGALDTLKWLRRVEPAAFAPNDDTMGAALATDDLGLIQWMHALGFSLNDADAWVDAIECRVSPAVLDWLADNSSADPDDVVREAYDASNTDALDWARARRWRLRPGQHLPRVLGERRHPFAVVRWIARHYPRVVRKRWRPVLVAALEASDLRWLRWIHRVGLPMMPGDVMLRIAARSHAAAPRRAEVARWIRHTLMAEY